MTKDLVGRDIPLQEITIDLVDDMMRGEFRHQYMPFCCFELIQSLCMRSDVLHFHTDPELLIVHHVPGASQAKPSEGSGTEAAASWRRRALMGLCPAQSLELHGFPFWMLRITEI